MKSTWLVVLAASGALAPIAAAQPVVAPAQVDEPAPAASATLGVDIVDPENLLAADSVRDAIGAELGVPLVDGRAFAPSLGRIEIMVDGGVLHIAYHPAAGTLIERQLALPASPADRVQLIAFVVTNLVRDQATEVIAELPAVQVPVVPPAANQPPTKSPVTRSIPFTLGLVPPVALDNAFGERVSVAVGIHGVIGLADSSTIVSISGAADIKRVSAAGVQIGGAASYAGRMYGLQVGGAASYANRMSGLQVGGAASYAGRMSGLQVGGAASYAGPMRGIQIGGAASYASRMYGIQIGGAASYTDHMRGIQIGGAATYAGQLRGLQIGGAASAAGRVDGAQIAGGINVARDVDGAQIAGAVNVARDLHGVQIGAINIARKVRGAQIGVINLSDDGDDSFPIGVINYSRNGGVAFDGLVDSSRVSSLAFRHGTRHIHNIWSVGWSPDHDNFLVGAGLGLTRAVSDAVKVDVDAMHWLTDLADVEYSQLNQLRVSAAIRVAPGIDAFGGVAANVYVNDGMDESANFHPTMARTYQPTDATTVVVWPSAFAGVRLHAR